MVESGLVTDLQLGPPACESGLNIFENRFLAGWRPALATPGLANL